MFTIFTDRPPMMLKRFLPCVFCLLCCAHLASSQVRITGRVTDADNGSPLASASIGIVDTDRGVTANRDGTFWMLAPSVPFTLEVRFIGYRTRRLKVDSIPTGPMDIRLEPSTITLEEIVVTDEGPADAVMRQVIAAKQKWRRHLVSAYADTYTRFMLYSHSELVQMTETVRASWWTPGNGARELVRARRRIPEGSGTFRFAEPHAVVNFYDDVVRLMGTEYVGPTHPDALEAYFFLLGGTRELDGHRVFDIYFTPRSATRPGFSGHVAVIDSLFVLYEVNVRPIPQTMVTPPVKRHDVYYEQRFTQVRDSVWMPIDMYVAGVVEFGRLGVTHPPARYEQFSSQTLHVVNPPVPDSMSVGGPPVLESPLADRQDFLFLRNPSMIPLTPMEQDQVMAIDRARDIQTAFQGQGLLLEYVSFPLTKEEIERSQAKSDRVSIVKRLRSGDWFWYNRVDGWHPGVSWSSLPGAGVQYEASVGWSTLRERVSWNSEISLPLSGPEMGLRLGVAYINATSVSAREGDLGRFVPGISTYLGNDDIYDYYHQRAVSGFVRTRPHGGPVAMSLRLRSEIHSSLRKLTNFEGWLFTNEQPENPPIDAGHLRSFEWEIELGQGTDRGFTMQLEHSPGEGLGSDFTFTRVEGRATIAFETFFNSRVRPNRMRITVMGGTRSGFLPVQRRMTLSGSAGPFSDFMGFRTLSNGRFVATDMLGIFWYHDFATALFEKAGLWWVAEKGMGVHLFGGHGFTSGTGFDTVDGNQYHEIGGGVSYPFGLPFRFDLAGGITDNSFSVRIGRPFK